MALKARAEGESLLHAAGRGADLCEVRRALALLCDPENGMQLHANHNPGWPYKTFAGTDIEGMAGWVQQNEAAIVVYYTLNPCEPSLTVDQKAPHTLRRRWLLLQCAEVQG